MVVRPGRAVVVGGSVAGLLAAGALLRRGWDVTVRERTGADGYRSAVRAAVAPDARSSYSGYVLWRGTYDAALAPAAVLDVLEPGVLASPVHPGGHAVVYLVPGHDPGTLRMNWAMYGRLPADVRLDDPDAVPSGALDATFGTELERVLDHVPPLWADVMRIAPPDGRLVQPIYDHLPSTYAAPGVLLAGDAAAVARPHTGSGVAKAAEDAFALLSVLDSEHDLDGALAAYDAVRRPAGTATVETGRRLGHGMVERVPDWTSAGPDTMDAWAAAIRGSGPRTYMFDD